ncbi:hypothetical protein [Leptospira biflexa]|uniref:hypothetical protein n=1 Tax=Leptospira biflexa TaxID=172 RepID=UPI001083F0D6|nr:hypothetical protein [Leptospira biflexa]TGM35812.1 hypothetical protein EHQ89_09780 [Leptospira biflexa]TGM37182.1 hypothetical protein EHQ80_06160 [Leptospira biflexa]
MNLLHSKAIPLKLISLVLFGNCCMVPKHVVHARFSEYQIETTVDSELAKYYLENYIRNQKQNTEFDNTINQINSEFQGQNPNRNRLKQISDKTSVDFAAIYFANQMLHEKSNESLQKKFLSNLDYVKNQKLQYKDPNLLILLVPGFDYVENGKVTGADFAKPKLLLSQTGIQVHLVKIDPIGSVEENAEFIAKTISSFPKRNILMAGASSAGPAIHLALSESLNRDQAKQIKAWLNLGGVLQGVPVLDQFSKGIKGFLFKTIVWFKDWRIKSFQSMQTEVSRTRFSKLNLPEHIYILNYIGMSLSGDISRFAYDKYCMMRDDGPNDGLSLLPDLVAPNSHTILAPKSDHFFAEDPEIDIKTLALLKTILDHLGYKNFPIQ